jgi:hypothetical protein
MAKTDVKKRDPEPVYVGPPWEGLWGGRSPATTDEPN